MQILEDKILDAQLAKDGFVVVPFLNQEEVSDLTNFFYSEHKSIPGFYATAHSSDLGFRNRMNEKIKSVFQNAIEKYFVNCTPLGGSFVVKSNEQKERLHPHQDWNIVDEEKYRSFNIWVPLVNLKEENGAIRVLPKSHLWGLNYRGPSIPDSNGDKIELIWDDMTTLMMRAGEALIYDHRLYHASYPNNTDEWRLATVFGIKPSEAEMYYYFGEAGGHIGMYKSSVDFFMNGNIQEGNKTLEKVKIIGDLKKSSSFVERLKSIFNAFIK